MMVVMIICLKNSQYYDPVTMKPLICIEIVAIVTIDHLLLVLIINLCQLTILIWITQMIIRIDSSYY